MTPEVITGIVISIFLFLLTTAVGLVIRGLWEHAARLGKLEVHDAAETARGQALSGQVAEVLVIVRGLGDRIDRRVTQHEQRCRAYRGEGVE